MKKMTLMYIKETLKMRKQGGKKREASNLFCQSKVFVFTNFPKSIVYFLNENMPRLPGDLE